MIYLISKSAISKADNALSDSLDVVMASLKDPSEEPSKKDIYALKAVYHARNIIGTALKYQQTIRLMLRDIDAQIEDMKKVYNDMIPEYFDK